MNRWKKFLDETGPEDEAGPAFESKVLDAAKTALRQHRPAEDRGGAGVIGSWSWLAWAAPTAAVAAVVIALNFSSSPSDPVADADSALARDIEMAENYGVIRDLEEIRQMEFLQTIGDPSRWDRKAKKPRKS